MAWTRRSRQGFFLRAEDFFGRLKGLARIEARVSREKAEANAGVRVDEPKVVGGIHPDEQAASAFLGLFDSRSHGESFMDLFTERIRPGGLYLLDEPEAPLSPRRQIAFLDVLTRTAKAAPYREPSDDLLRATPAIGVWSKLSATTTPRLRDRQRRLRARIRALPDR